jgi:hypothetical protein
MVQEANKPTNDSNNSPKGKAPSKTIAALSSIQRRARARRRLKGAEERINTHREHRDFYRDVIKRREIIKTKSNGDRITVQLSEFDVEEFRAKKLMEEAHLMQAKLDQNEYQKECESLLGSNTAGILQTLQSGRSTEYARRMGPRTAEKVLDAVKVDEGFENLKQKTSGKRKEFRVILWDLIVKVSPELKKEFEVKPKLFTRVVELLEEQLKPEPMKAGV